MEPSRSPEPPAQPDPDPDPAGLALARAVAVEEYRSRLESAGRVLDGVDRALSALADGTYGTCAACGAPIDDMVLAQDPTALHCAGHGPRG